MQTTPQKAAALSVLLAAPDHALTRIRGGFRPADSDAAIVTVRTARALDDAGLVEFDDPLCPSQIRLTPHGLAAAEQLATAKAVRA